MLNRGVVWKELRTKRQELRDKGRGFVARFVRAFVGRVIGRKGRGLRGLHRF
jgi:hypothetical protein